MGQENDMERRNSTEIAHRVVYADETNLSYAMRKIAYDASFAEKNSMLCDEIALVNHLADENVQSASQGV